MEDREIIIELNRVLTSTTFCSSLSIDKYIKYAEKHDLDFRHFPLLNCGFIIFKDNAIILRAEEEGTILSINGV